MTEGEILLQSQLEKSNKQLQESRLENKLLREKVDALVRMIYGPKSEKLGANDPNQLTLLDQEQMEAEAEAKKPIAPDADPSAGADDRSTKKRKKPAGPRLPENLPVEETIVDPLEVQAEPEAWRLMGQEVSEQLDYRPGRFVKLRLVRNKYVRRDHPFAAPVIAPLPPSLQERCLAAPGLIAHIIASKYIDHLPLYRQEQIYRQRHKIELPRQSLCRWVALAAEWLEPVYNEMRRQQMTSDYVQIDETPIRYLDPGRGKCATGYFWVSNVPGGDVIYHWHPGRGADCLEHIVPTGYEGTLQCDGYSAYPSFQKHRKARHEAEHKDDPKPEPLKLELAACWAHARRKFFQAKGRDPTVADWILRQIGQLYLIEKRLRETGAGPALRQAVRASESAIIIARLKAALLLVTPRYLPKSGMGKAIAYARGQWAGLERYVSSGALEIDQNLVENAIRPSALGKKNWMFIGSEASGKTSAILYTIVESAKRHGLEPKGYLHHLLETLPKSTNKQVPALTPAAVAKTQARRQRQLKAEPHLKDQAA
jgi:transposase